MKIAYFIAGKISKIAGLEKHTLDLINNISQDSSFTVSLIADYSYQKYLNKKITFIPIEDTSRFNPFLYVKILRILETHNFDIIHSQASKASFILSVIKNKFPNVKFIATIHNKKNNVKFFNIFDYVIGVSSETLQNIKTKNSVIYNGIIQPIAKNQMTLKEIFPSLQEKLPILIAVGRMVPAKGFDILLKAIEPLNINLIFVGDGIQKNNLINICDQLKIKDKVFFAGFRDNVYDFISQSNLVIIPSRNEGFPYVFVETMLLKKALIATNISDIHHFIESSYLAKPEDYMDLRKKIQNALNNLEEYTIKFSSFFEKAERQLTLDKMIENTKAIYYTLLKKAE